MHKRDTVIEALNHRKTERIPHYINFASLLESKLQEYYKTSNLWCLLDNYILWVSVNPIVPSSLEGNSYTDGFGITWANVGVTRGYVVDHPLKESNLNKCKFPNPCSEQRYMELKKERQENQGLFNLVKIGDLFERAHYLRGLENLMVDMQQNPAFVDELFERLTAFLLEVLERITPLGFDGISLSDDYGYQGGLMMSPAHWRRYIKPHLSILFSEVKEKGLYVFLHCDGNVEEIIPDLIEVGVDALHPVQSEVMDVFKLKREYGNYLTLFGGIGVQEMLPFDKPEKIKSHVKSTANILNQNGGFILCPGIGMLEDTPVENAAAFIEAALAL